MQLRQRLAFESAALVLPARLSGGRFVDGVRLASEGKSL
jgi:hypothetical protein